MTSPSFADWLEFEFERLKWRCGLSKDNPGDDLELWCWNKSEFNSVRGFDFDDGNPVYSAKTLGDVPP